MALKRAKKKSRYPKHPFDVEHGTDTGGLTPGPALKTGHAHDRHNTAYYGIAPSILKRLIAQWKQTKPPHALSKYSFIDFGAGKGRAMLLASEFGFKEVVGIELHPALAKKCRGNMRIWHASRKKTAPMRLSRNRRYRVHLSARPMRRLSLQPIRCAGTAESFKADRKTIQRPSRRSRYPLRQPRTRSRP